MDTKYITYFCIPNLIINFRIPKIYFIFFMLKKFYDTLDDDNKKIFVKRVLETTGWSLATFYYKLRNDNLSLLEQAAINKIIESWDTTANE